MSRVNPNRLLVEGDEEKRVIPYFMNEHVEWGGKPADWVVHIEEFGGLENMLKPGVIEAELKTPGLRSLGIIVDANDNILSHWSRVRQRCLKAASDLPEDLPSEGLIHRNEDGLGIGVWIMPDNRSRGMLETFLGHLLKPETADLWSFARESCAQSKNRGALYTAAHYDKASVHTYLAWLEPPGRSLHVSVLARALDSKSPLGETFVRWFMELYQLAPRQNPLP